MKKHKKMNRVDKHGLPVLDRVDDLQARFLGDDSGEHFTGIFEESFSPEEFKHLLAEKNKNDSGGPLRSIAERIRDYPLPLAAIDLHGCTAAEALKKTDSFLLASRQKRIFTVRIITGRGTHSKGEAVLPAVVAERVEALKNKGVVLAARWEGRRGSSSGSLIVYLEDFLDP